VPGHGFAALLHSFSDHSVGGSKHNSMLGLFARNQIPLPTWSNSDSFIVFFFCIWIESNCPFPCPAAASKKKA
jgi:hypothetical protein